MSQSRYNAELSMLDAEELVSVFFHNNQELIDTFNAICAHMLDWDSNLMIRARGGIIGISKHGEYYRLYISLKKGEYWIKYKNRQESERFVPSDLKTYLAYNTSCNEFFAENKDSLVTKKRTRSLEEWLPIQTKAENGLKFVDHLSPDTRYADTVYDEIVELLADACSDRELVKECDGEIIINRRLNSPPVTLQSLGERYHVTGERIRQREKRAWRKLTIGIYHCKYEKFVPYKERLIRILLNIPDEVFINTIVQISRRNAIIGSWLQMVVARPGE